jgi:hypothetical protein
MRAKKTFSGGGGRGDISKQRHVQVQSVKENEMYH